MLIGLELLQITLVPWKNTKVKSLSYISLVQIVSQALSRSRTSPWRSDFHTPPGFEGPGSMGNGSSWHVFPCATNSDRDLHRWLNLEHHIHHKFERNLVWLNVSKAWDNLIHNILTILNNKKNIKKTTWWKKKNIGGKKYENPFKKNVSWEKKRNPHEQVLNLLFEIKSLMVAILLQYVI